jgi:hypothetical protein
MRQSDVAGIHNKSSPNATILFSQRTLRRVSREGVTFNPIIGALRGERPHANGHFRDSVITDTGVLRPLAPAARVQVEFKAEVLRLRVGSLLKLQDQIVVLALGQFRRAHEGVAFLLELKHGFAALRVRAKASPLIY